MTWFNADGSPAANQGGHTQPQESTQPQGLTQLITDEPGTMDAAACAATFMKSDPRESEAEANSVLGQVKQLARASFVEDGQVVTKSDPSEEADLEPLIKSFNQKVHLHRIYADKYSGTPAQELHQKIAALYETGNVDAAQRYTELKKSELHPFVEGGEDLLSKAETPATVIDQPGSLRKSEGGLPTPGSTKLPKPEKDEEEKREEKAAMRKSDFEEEPIVKAKREEQYQQMNKSLDSFLSGGDTQSETPESILEDLVKAKYTKRTGTPGNYKYEYADDKKGTKKSPGSSAKRFESMVDKAHSKIEAARFIGDPAREPTKDEASKKRAAFQAAAQHWQAAADVAPDEASKKRAIRERDSNQSMADKMAQKMKKSMGFDTLKDWTNNLTDIVGEFTKSAGQGGLPASGVRRDLPGGGVGDKTQTEDGGKVEDAGKTSVPNSPKGGETVATTAGVQTTPTTEVLSEDDDKSSLQKSFAEMLQEAPDGGERARAQLISRLRRGDVDVRIGYGTAERRSEDLQKSEDEGKATAWCQQGGMVLYSDESDRQVEHYLKKGGQYQTMQANVQGQLHREVECSHCGNLTKSVFSDCQECGVPRGQPLAEDGKLMVMEKSVLSSLMPPEDDDVVIG